MSWQSIAVILAKFRSQTSGDKTQGWGVAPEIVAKVSRAIIQGLMSSLLLLTTINGKKLLLPSVQVNLQP